jgi:hypothetical protein
LESTEQYINGNLDLMPLTVTDLPVNGRILGVYLGLKITILPTSLTIVFSS